MRVPTPGNCAVALSSVLAVAGAARSNIPCSIVGTVVGAIISYVDRNRSVPDDRTWPARTQQLRRVLSGSWNSVFGSYAMILPVSYSSRERSQIARNSIALRPGALRYVHRTTPVHTEEDFAQFGDGTSRYVTQMPANDATSSASAVLSEHGTLRQRRVPHPQLNSLVAATEEIHYHCLTLTWDSAQWLKLYDFCVYIVKTIDKYTKDGLNLDDKIVEVWKLDQLLGETARKVQKISNYTVLQSLLRRKSIEETITELRTELTDWFTRFRESLEKHSVDIADAAGVDRQLANAAFPTLEIVGGIMVGR